MFSILKKVANKAKDMLSTANAKVMVTVGAVMIGASAFAEGEAVTLPTTGVDVSAYVTAAITALGGVVAVCLGGYVAFKLINFGMKWLGKLGKA